MPPKPVNKPTIPRTNIFIEIVFIHGAHHGRHTNFLDIIFFYFLARESAVF